MLLTICMVETKKLLVESEIAIDVPIDIASDSDRMDDIIEGLRRALTKGLYEQGVDFEVRRVSFRLEQK
jgi:hypothetical protein